MFCDVDLSVHYQLVCRTRGIIKSIQLAGIHSQNHTPVSPLHWGPFIINIINILLFLIIIKSSSLIVAIIIISDTQAEDGPMEFSISVPNLQETSLHRNPVFNRWSNVPPNINTEVKLVSSGNPNISHDDNYYGAQWEKRGASVPFFWSPPKVVPKSSQSSPKSSSSIPYLVLRKSQSSSQAISE